MLRVLIVDDEDLARRGIRARLRNARAVEIVGECADGATAVTTIRSERPDLVFLDVQMPEMDGFSVLDALEPDEVPAVIFLTAFDQHALRAFEVHALDYLLKPVDDDRFREAFDRARHTLERDTDDRFIVKDGGRIRFIRSKDIDWIEAAGDYVCLHVGHTRHLMRETLTAMEARLDDHHFLRIHRSTIVNVERIRELVPHFNGEHIVVLHDGTRLKQSRSYRERIQTLVGNVR